MIIISYSTGTKIFTTDFTYATAMEKKIVTGKETVIEAADACPFYKTFNTWIEAREYALGARGYANMELMDFVFLVNKRTVGARQFQETIQDNN